MAGRHQKEQMRRNLPPDWRKQFVPTGGVKIACITCDRTGYQWGEAPSPWMLACLRGHPEVCEDCGTRYIRGGLRMHRRCLDGHENCVGHCPKRRDDG